ncbi:hypothetical protein DV532_28085 (plasmid) [Pseudomonas sp. Leaf58]|uniref:hypothetical protein n=1 Tax=Pseudomonas sp. Leaf58 TaxID=1736226 RepID=UPI0006FF5F56|nr:hypothetical protein [Pseudomonas sp. Leaf58]AYG48129.1 hypothetical protein DV532_28085 [Pseudomonas sp. Leaf58]KQN62317.1 hypothetical protein ASF02_09135 [Pseudomonas sp. Leaf58]
MNQAETSQTDLLLKHKLESIALSISETELRMNDQLIALLEPPRLIALWKLKDLLGKIQALITQTLAQPELKVSDSMLDLVQSTDAVLVDINGRLDAFEVEE